MKFLIKLILAAAIIFGAYKASHYYMTNKPEAKRKKTHTKMASRVSVSPVILQNKTVKINTMGTVIPANEMTLKAETSGKIVEISELLIPGTLIAEGSQIFKIDPTDYEIEVSRKESAKVKKEYELKLEMGQQAVAKRQWEMLNQHNESSEQEKELALRIPHLENAQASLRSAESDLEKARLNLSRTNIKAPFNSILREKNVEMGSYVTAKDNLAVLTGTDEFWIQVSIPVEKLRWLSVPKGAEKGSTAVITYGNSESETRKGKILRLLVDMEKQGRMAKLLISVKDPFSIQPENKDKRQLVLGSYVRVELEGKKLDDIYEIPRSSLRDNNTLWTVTKNDTLKIISVDVVWKDENNVFVKNNFSVNTQIITSDLSTPIKGMPLVIHGKKQEEGMSVAKADKKGKKQRPAKAQQEEVKND